MATNLFATTEDLRKKAVKPPVAKPPMSSQVKPSALNPSNMAKKMPAPAAPTMGVATTPPPVAMPSMTQPETDASKISITKNIESPVSNPAADTTARKSGFELYMAEKRGARGGRLSKGGSRKGLVYTEGEFAGMTEGQADAIESRRYREMKPEERAQYNIIDEGDFQLGKERSMDVEKTSMKMQRENEAAMRAEKEAAASGVAAPANPPVVDPSKKYNYENKSATAVLDSPVENKGFASSSANTSSPRFGMKSASKIQVSKNDTIANSRFRSNPPVSNPKKKEEEEEGM